MSRIAASLLLALVALPGVSWAQASTGEPVVYHSPGGSGSPPSTTPWLIGPGDGQELHLYIDYDNAPDGGASLSGTMCVDADGDETCGFDVWLEMTTDAAVFSAFTPAAAGIVGQIDAGTGTTFKVNGLDTSGMSIPAPIGTLVVDATGSNQLQITVKGMHRVGAAGQLDAIQEQVIVMLPEPSGLGSLASGALLLAGLARWRVCARR